jgi:murein L,D-transpeptidase YafK
MRNKWALAVALFGLLGAQTLRAQSLTDPHIVVHKAQRLLEVYAGSQLFKSYRVGLGLNPVPAKRRQGDRATPEGDYTVCGKNPASTYYMALVLSYPNPTDAVRGVADGLINAHQQAEIAAAAKLGRCPPFGTPLGGEVEIHGMGSQSDWTWGCIALDNAAIRELYAWIPLGTPVTIKP